MAGQLRNIGSADVTLSSCEVQALDDALDKMKMSAVFGETKLKRQG